MRDEGMHTLFISNISWDFVWQRHQTLATLYAQDGPVIYCEIPGIRRPALRDTIRIWKLLTRSLKFKVRKQNARSVSNVSIVSPILLPATNAVFCKINRHLIGRLVRLHLDPKRIWLSTIVNYSASRSAIDLIAKLSYKRLIYDCTDDWLAVAGVPTFLADDESWLLRNADLVLVPSRVLLARKQTHARNIVHVPHGALVDRFYMAPKRPASNITALYYGHLHRQHLDFKLIEEISQRRPEWQIVLVGPIKTPCTFGSNVTLTGQVEHERLHAWIERADVLILPYLLNRYTEAVMPAKTYECLATGRPVVATPLPELKSEFASCFRFAQTPGEWIEQIELTLKTDSMFAIGARIELARKNSWQSRYRLIQALANGAAPKEDGFL